MFNHTVMMPAAIPSFLKDKICVSSRGYDASPFMTGLLLLYTRVEDLKISYDEFITTEEIEDKVFFDPTVYSFVWFNGVKTNPDEILKPIAKKVKTIEKLPAHEKFISDQLNQKIGIRILPEENTVCIFAEKMNSTVFHATQTFTGKYFRIFKEKPLTSEEKSFLESLTFKTSVKYQTAITDLTLKEDFKRFVLDYQLVNFEKKLFDMKVEKARSNLEDIESIMDRAMEDYRKACERRVEAVALIEGLNNEANKRESQTELKDYLTKNKRICNINIDGSFISFIVKTFLAPHHIDEWETITNNERFFSKFKGTYTPGEIKLLLDAVFGENRCLQMKMCAYFKVEYFGSSVNSLRQYDFECANSELKDYVPNPHLHFHNCFGQNKLIILEQLKDGDIIGAIECSISCAQKINIHESMTFDPFVNYILSKNGKYFVTEDGRDLTTKEAIEFLKGKNNA